MPRRKVQTSNTLTASTPTKIPVAPAPNAAALLERFKDYPAIEVISRRFNDPNDPGSLPILLRDEDPHCCTNTDHQRKLKTGSAVCTLCKPERPARKWYVRYFNLAQEGRNAQMRSKGYVPVEVKELQDADDISDLYTGKDAYVRRGDRGQELLGKMPLELYTEIKRRQRIERNARAVSKARVKEDLAESAGAELGDEAGQSIHDGAILVESMTRSKTTLGDEAGVTDE